MKTRQYIMTLCAFFLMLTLLFAQDGTEEDFGPKPQREAEAKKRHEENLKKYKDDKDVLVLPGLVAKRKERRVEILTETTAVNNEDAVEFLVVSLNSSHGYESFMWSYAKPSDIHKALVFIGIPEGAPYNPNARRFWAKGEPVIASIEDDQGNATRLENLIYNKTTEESLPEKGYIFTGSIYIPDPRDPAKQVYLADAYDPKCIIAGFNSGAGVLEPVWKISKAEAYQTYQIHPDFGTGSHTLQSLVLEPGLETGKRLVKELMLTIQNHQTFIIADNQGKQLTPDQSVKAALQKCLEFLKQGQEPFVTLKFNTELMLAEIQQVSRGLVMLDQPAALRIEPPLPGRIYYRSFLAPEQWKDAENRMSQAWEVHITGNAGTFTSTMVFYEEIWKSGSTKPELKKHAFDAPTPQSIRQHLDSDAAKREKENARMLAPTLFVYAPANMTYQQLLDFLKPAMKTHNTLHLYLEMPTAEGPTP